ncbi:protein of unknown function [Legionella fallonii LLAP-10]|uniref:Uncharacterized protein n=1 Tax=Legionella fallonii LLAP-10 TaxID=1212491 RepID=A0A098G0Z9_9GAMM|nr:protein of unknown function [Legionella fallonii LLAP-10]
MLKDPVIRKRCEEIPVDNMNINVKYRQKPGIPSLHASRDNKAAVQERKTINSS